MTHKCEYCTKNINPCTKPCIYAKDNSHVCCTCVLDPLTNTLDSSKCELPERVICDSAICNAKFQVLWLENKILELKESAKNEKLKLQELKDVNNHFRILGIGPNSLETLIKTQGITLPFIQINKSENFSWDKLPPEDLVTIGLSFMRSYETLAKNWASFLSEKVSKVKIKKESLAKTEAKLKESQGQTKHKTNGSNGATPKPKSESKLKLNLNPTEKIVLHHIKKLGLPQKDAEVIARSFGLTDPIRENLGV